MQESRPAAATALDSFDLQALSLCCIGSHSALDVCLGAKRAGLKNVVVAARGREQTYARHYRGRPDGTGCVDETLIVDHFADVLSPEVQQTLLGRNALFVPSRSFQVYARQRHSHDAIERDMRLPLFGSRRLLRAEDRAERPNQYDLLGQAGIRHPHRPATPDEIDGMTLVKAPHAKVPHERAFFLTTSSAHCRLRTAQLLADGVVTEAGLEAATLEEYVVGPAVNLNFFWSPLLQELELLGTDTRRQTNLDGALSLLAADQAALGDGFVPSMEEAGHVAATLTESMLEQAFDMGERLIAAAARVQPPGIIGPFALQCVIASGPPKTFVVYDLSLRIPGSPGSKYTPYSAYRWGRELSVGERIAKEVAMARDSGKLAQICT
jgi:5-formaminoimidazole-4-carboxamide-1-(beta)-D-ribofuranosyl 5'-monophosphate synthetase